VSVDAKFEKSAVCREKSKKGRVRQRAEKLIADS